MKRFLWVALCLFFVSNADESRAQSQYADNNYYQIYFVNECNRRIQTAIRAIDLSGNWVTKGWWILEPGEQAFVVQTKNKIFYSYAESIGPAANRLYWRGSDQNYRIRNSSNTFGFRKRDMNMSNWGDWRERFTCN